MLQPLVEAGQQGSPAGEDDAAVHDVAGELRRRLVQCGLHRIDDRVDGLLDGFADLRVADHDRLGQAADQVAAADLGLLLLGDRKRRADRHLDLFCGSLAQCERVFLLDVGDDRFVEFIAADPDALAGDDATEGDHRDLGGAAADVDDHVAGRLADRQAGADRRRHRLLDDENLAGTGVVGRFLDRPLLDAGHPTGDTHDDARAADK